MEGSSSEPLSTRDLGGISAALVTLLVRVWGNDMSYRYCDQKVNYTIKYIFLEI